jgi:hypothetical protein
MSQVQGSEYLGQSLPLSYVQQYSTFNIWPQRRIVLNKYYSSVNKHVFLQYLPNSYGVLFTTVAKLFISYEI